MPVVRSMKDEGSKSGSTSEGAASSSSPRNRHAAAPPGLEIRPEGGPGEWLQQFAWALEDSNLESAGYFLHWIQSEGEAWAISQALELGVERLKHAPEGKGSAAALVRLYHHLGPLYPRTHQFHELFLERLELRIRAMAPGAPALTVASAIERALDLFRKGLEIHDAYNALQISLENLKIASNRTVQQEKERELEMLMAGGEHGRALELCRHLVETYQSPLAAGLMPTLLARLGPQALAQESGESISSRRMREWDWPGEDDGRAGGRHLRMVRGEREVQIPRTPWGKAFEAPPNPADYRNSAQEQEEFSRASGRPLRRDDPVSLPELRSNASFNEGSDPNLTLPASLTISGSVDERPASGSEGQGRTRTPSTGGPTLGAQADKHASGGTPRSGEFKVLTPQEITAALSRQDGRSDGRADARGDAHDDETIEEDARITADPLVPPPSLRSPVTADGSVGGRRGSSTREADAGQEGPGLLVHRTDPSAGNRSDANGDGRSSSLRFPIIALSLVVGLLAVLLITWFWTTRKPPVDVTIASPGASTGTGEAALPGTKPGETAAQPNVAAVEEKLPVASGPPGKLSLDISPDDKLELYLDGVYYPEGKISGLSVPSGQHVLEIFRQGYEPFKQELFTNPDLETKVSVNLARSPDLSLDVSPSDGVAVKLNGRLVTAHLPLKNYVLPPGPQSLEISREGYQTHTEQFKATIASSVQLKVTLKPAN